MIGLLEQVVSDEVASCESAIDAEDWQLRPEELELVARAVPVRQREVAAGREMARRALAAAGAPIMPILSEPGRAPVWPHGFTGSISHTPRWVGAAVAPTRLLRSIGIDGEQPIADLSDRWIASVCRPAERVWLQQAAPADRAVRAALLFSAKESLHKCRFPLTRDVLEFTEVEVELDEQGGLVARLVAPPAPDAISRWAGRYAVSVDLVVTAVEWPA